MSASSSSSETMEVDDSDQAKAAYLQEHPFGSQFLFNKAARASPLHSYDFKFLKMSNGERKPVSYPTFCHCITALSDYQHKSLEELRWEDYMVGRKTASNSQPAVTQVANNPHSSITVNNYNISLNLSPPASPFNPFASRSSAPTQLPLINPFASRYAATTQTPPRVNNQTPTPPVNPNTMGTFLKFRPVLGVDIKDSPTGGYNYLDTQIMSITAMLEYEKKSIEELRWEDYLCKRKFKSPSSASTSSSETTTAKKPPTEPSNNKASKLTDSNSVETETTCPICLKTIKELKDLDIRLMVTICGHMLCKECTVNLVRYNKRVECPTCRKSLVLPKDIHDLYI